MLRKGWAKRVSQRTLCVGAATTAAVIACDVAENRKALGALNAISHIAWQDDALRQDGLSAKYTGLALGLNMSAHAGWALVYEVLFGRTRGRNALIGGVLVALLAYVVDYHLVPPRYTPGFEHRLSCRSTLFIYATLALALARPVEDAD